MNSPKDPPVLTLESAAAAPTWRAAYSDRTAALMAAFSQLAYVPFETGEVVAADAVSGAPEETSGRRQLRGLLGAGGFQLVATFNSDDTQAYLASRPDQFSVLAFRGTTDLRDWETNARIGRKVFHSNVPLNRGRRRLDRGAAPEVFVHEGFLHAYEVCGDAIATAVNTAIPADRGLYITGHSLGGALAQIASAILERDTLAACYTYGSPRVGTAAFDRVVKCPHYRGVNNWDIVPGVPLETPWGYQHSGDPRLLVPAEDGRAALRRDRNPLIRVGVDIFAFAVSLMGDGVFVVNDHMIWNYREKLERIAAFRDRRAAANRPARPSA